MTHRANHSPDAGRIMMMAQHDQIRKTLDELFENAKFGNAKYSRKNRQIEGFQRNMTKVVTFISTITNAREVEAAQMYSGLIKIDDCTYVIHVLSISNKIGIKRSTLNGFLQKLGAATVSGEEAELIKKRTFLQKIENRSKKRQWSVRRSSQPLFDEKTVRSIASESAHDDKDHDKDDDNSKEDGDTMIKKETKGKTQCDTASSKSIEVSSSLNSKIRDNHNDACLLLTIDQSLSGWNIVD